MGDLTKVYVNQSGLLAKTIFVIGETNYDHTIHDEPGLVGVVLSQDEYKGSAPPILVNGIAYAPDIYAVVAAKLSQVNPALSAIIIANNINPAAVIAPPVLDGSI